ncbi:hypothetical protein ANN_23545 [Periplaneta americana]|uniref:Uncharacterized protein n=1 Tax=Periplaneta americana TaxID=6978 RepID=A0ABQ8SLU5_PERAM|nr:hypothetical protein ANN_23545 [Periplaneta americana]
MFVVSSSIAKIVAVCDVIKSKPEQQKSSPYHSLRNHLLLLVQTEFVERHDTATACLQYVNETHSNVQKTPRSLTRNEYFHYSQMYSPYRCEGKKPCLLASNHEYGI